MNQNTNIPQPHMTKRKQEFADQFNNAQHTEILLKHIRTRDSECAPCTHHPSVFVRTDLAHQRMVSQERPRQSHAALKVSPQRPEADMEPWLTHQTNRSHDRGRPGRRPSPRVVLGQIPIPDWTHMLAQLFASTFPCAPIACGHLQQQ